MLLHGRQAAGWLPAQPRPADNTARHTHDDVQTSAETAVPHEVTLVQHCAETTCRVSGTMARPVKQDDR